MIAGILERIRSIEPYGQPLPDDVWSLWPLGSRTVLSSRGVLVVASLPALLTAMLLAPVVGFPPALGISVVAGLLSWVALAWVFPVADIQQTAPENVQLYQWLAVRDRSLVAYEATLVVAYVPKPGEPGTFCVAGKNGNQYVFGGGHGNIPVLKFWDPFKKFRLDKVAPEVPSEQAWIADTLMAVRDHRQQVKRTSEYAADPDVVRLYLQQCGLEEGRFPAVVQVAREMGLLNRHPFDSLDISNAGWVWLHLLVEQAANDASVDQAPWQFDDIKRAVGEAMAELPHRNNAASPQDFPNWASGLIVRFRDFVELTDSYNLLWNGPAPKDERAVQQLAYLVFNAECRAQGIDMVRESLAGDGPVDFRFSKGWGARALVEVKLLKSAKIYHGASRQLPRYMRSEGIDCGFYVCVGFHDADFSEARLERIASECQSAGDELGYAIHPVFVDASRRSAPSVG